MKTLYLTDDVKDRSFTTAKTYEDSYSIVSIGRTGDSGLAVKCISISIKIDDCYIFMVGGEKIVKQWENTIPEKISDFAWSMLLANLTIEIFQSLIREIQLSATYNGKLEAQKEIRQALGIN